MTDWYMVTRSDWVIQDEFLPVWMANGGPKDAALFTARNQRERTNTFYFSPSAARIAGELIARYGAVKCPRPEISELVLLVGDQSAIEGSC